MALYRDHRGGLAESMATVREIPDKAALVADLGYLLSSAVVVTDDTVHVEWYATDDRIGWDTWIVTIDNYGPTGFTNGPLA